MMECVHEVKYVGGPEKVVILISFRNQTQGYLCLCPLPGLKGSCVVWQLLISRPEISSNGEKGVYLSKLYQGTRSSLWICLEDSCQQWVHQMRRYCGARPLALWKDGLILYHTFQPVLWVGGGRWELSVGIHISLLTVPRPCRNDCWARSSYTLGWFSRLPCLPWALLCVPLAPPTLPFSLPDCSCGSKQVIHALHWFTELHRDWTLHYWTYFSN